MRKVWVVIGLEVIYDWVIIVFMYFVGRLYCNFLYSNFNMLFDICILG